MEGTTESPEQGLLQAAHPWPLHAMQPLLLRAKLELIPTISTPAWCMQWEPTSWGAKGIWEVPVASFILDTVLALSETLPCPGDGGAPPLG